ncbi:hypothetical protein OsJ_11566 [Oryza sativa Japonica Group]|uniref:Uncharacterized protein n=1 Tax=Oryza sativa subsp. japonica TaxID=39947 RepID=B9F9G8_ORYSJ|nr:hypothetical protein OsJ_11566 [Oryza sativa Japonica Group]
MQLVVLRVAKGGDGGGAAAEAEEAEEAHPVVAVTPALTDTRNVSRQIAKSNGAPIPTQLLTLSLLHPPLHRSRMPASTGSIAVP